MASVSTEIPAGHSHRSLKEVETAVRQAALAEGLPNGLETDIAFAARWLELRGLPGAALAGAAISAWKRKPGDVRHGITEGVDLISLLAEQAAQRPDVPALWEGKLAGPLGLLPHMAAASASGKAVHLSWHSRHGRQQALALCSAGAQRVRYSDPAVLTTSDWLPVTLVMSIRPVPVQGIVPTAFVLDAWDLDRRRDVNLLTGVAVDDEVFARLQRMADGMLVPSG